MIAGLEEITSGDLQIDGKRVNEVGPADRGLAMVFQSYALYPHMTVAQNMGFALRLARVPKAERDRKVAEAARILQLGPYFDRRRRTSPAASGSASPSAAPSCATRACSCSTSRSVEPRRGAARPDAHRAGQACTRTSRPP